MAQEIRVPLGALKMDQPSQGDIRVPVGTLQTERQPDFRSETIGIVKDTPIDSIKGLVEFLNPYPAAKAVVTAYATMPNWEKALLGPAGPLKPLVQGLGRAHLEELRKGKEAFDQGRYSEMIGHLAAAAIPGIGPAAANVAETANEGKYWEAGGKLAAMVLPTSLVTRNIRIPSPLRNQNPAEVAAVDFGVSRGIPVDAATATGNPVVRGAQYVVDRSLGGAIPGARAARRADEALTSVGGDLANQVRPGGSITPEQAGSAMRSEVRAAADAFKAEANTAYSELRRLEAAAPSQTRSVKPGQPFQSMRMAVDVRGARQGFSPLYDELKREAELVPLQGDRAKVFVALDRLMNGPDYQPLSVVDGALSDLKSIARTDDALKRTMGQGVAARVVSDLDKAVRDAATAAGPDAINALMQGRAATVNKYKVIDVLDQIADEPVQAFNQATWAKDAGIDRLRDVAKYAPDAMTKVGRAYLENLLQKATAEGGFDKAQGILTQWQNLGPETKRLLFGNPSLVSDLDNFFLLAKKMKENPNPSGSGYTASLVAQTGYILTDPVSGTLIQIPMAALSKMLHSPRAVRALTNGFRVSLGSNRAAQAAAADEILSVANELGVQATRAADTRGQPEPARAGR